MLNPILDKAFKPTMWSLQEGIREIVTVVHLKNQDSLKLFLEKKFHIQNFTSPYQNKCKINFPYFEPITHI